MPRICPRRKSFEVVTCLEVLEHLEKIYGYKLLKGIEELACRRVVISTPSFFHVPPLEDSPGFSYVSFWSQEGLKALGFKLRG